MENVSPRGFTITSGWIRCASLEREGADAVVTLELVDRKLLISFCR